MLQLVLAVCTRMPKYTTTSKPAIGANLAEGDPERLVSMAVGVVDPAGFRSRDVVLEPSSTKAWAFKVMAVLGLELDQIGLVSDGVAIVIVGGLIGLDI